MTARAGSSWWGRSGRPTTNREKSDTFVSSRSAMRASLTSAIARMFYAADGTGRASGPQAEERSRLAGGGRSGALGALTQVEHRADRGAGLLETDQALQSLDDLGGLDRGGEHRPGEAGGLAVDLFGDELAVADDDAELVVQLVGDHAGCLDGALEARVVRDRVAHLGYVARDHDRRDDLATRRADRRDPRADPARLAVGVAETQQRRAVL